MVELEIHWTFPIISFNNANHNSKQIRLNVLLEKDFAGKAIEIIWKLRRLKFLKIAVDILWYRSNEKEDFYQLDVGCYVIEVLDIIAG